METIAVKSHHISVSYFMRMVVVHGMFALLKVFFILFGNTSLFFEEAQYWLWSNYLDLSYYSKPPLIAYANYISTGIFGNTELAVRLNAIICGFLIAVLVFRFTEKLTDNSRKAFWSAALLLAFPYFWLISYFFTTDSLVTLFWLWALYSLYRATENQEVYWISVGIAAGLGFLSKYVMLFFWPMALLYLLIFKPSLLRQPYPYLAIMLSLVFGLPVLLWNLEHHWVGIYHVLGLTGVDGTELSLAQSFLHFMEYIGGQLAFWILVIVTSLIFWIKKVFAGKVNGPIYLLMVPAVLIFLFFGLLSFFTHVEVNWTFFVLPPLAVLAVETPGLTSKYFRVRPIIIGTVMILFLSIPVIGEFVQIPGHLNPLRRIVGWAEMSARVGEIINENEEEILLMSDSYKSASMLSFYIQGHPVIHSFSPTKRMNQFDLWELKMKPDNNIKTIFIGQSEPEQTEAFGKKLEHYRVLRPYNHSEGQEYHVIIYDAFYGTDEHAKSKY